MEAIEGIKNVIFDLGGVIIDLRRENAVERLQALGIADADELLGLYRQQGPFLDIEVGRITPAEFFDSMRARCAAGTTDRQIELAFNSFLVRLPIERLEMLRRLRARGKRVFALSNTNAVMFNSWIRTAFEAERLKVDDYFDGIVASFREGVCKPDRRIFEIALERYSLVPEQTLMLDDSAANCEAARAAGMRAVQVGAPGQGPDAIEIAEAIV